MKYLSVAEVVFVLILLVFEADQKNMAIFIPRESIEMLI